MEWILILKEKYLPNTIISGDCAIHFSKTLSLKPGENDSNPRTEKIGSLALKYLKTSGPAPKPLYMKGPDAKLPKERTKFLKFPKERAKFLKFPKRTC